VTIRNRVPALLAVVLALTACGPAPTTAGPQHVVQPAAKVLTPKESLQASYDKLTSSSYDFTLKVGAVRATGTVDPAPKASTIKLTAPIDETVNLEMDETVMAGKVLMRLDAGAANAALHFHPTKWLAIDLTKLKSETALPLDPAETADPLHLSDYLHGVTKVTATDAMHLAGTMDLTIMSWAPGLDQSDITKAGPKAKITPFTATLDADGRMTGLNIKGAVADNLAVALTFAHFGAVKAISAPRPVIAATADIYDLLNS
jgi:hypothetical protein